MQLLSKAEQERTIRRTQHAADKFLRDLALITQTHVQNGQRVAHSALGGSRDHMQRLIRRRTARTCHHLPQTAHDLLRRNASKVEALAPGQNRRREPLRLGGCQNEHHMSRRLLQRLQQRIEHAEADSMCTSSMI